VKQAARANLYDLKFTKKKNFPEKQNRLWQLLGNKFPAARRMKALQSSIREV
jgi:hypothetical protein